MVLYYLHHAINDCESHEFSLDARTGSFDWMQRWIHPSDHLAIVRASFGAMPRRELLHSPYCARRDIPYGPVNRSVEQ
jgi:hypothetical protein